MINITFLIIPLVAGYFFASRCFFTRYKIVRSEGQKLYFNAAFYGFFLLVICLWTYHYLVGKYPEIFKSLAKIFDFKIPQNKKDDYSISINTMISVSAITLTSGWVLPRIINLLTPKIIQRKFYKYAIKDKDFEQLLLRAVSEKKPVRLDLQSGKVYVGRVLSTIDPPDARKEIKILPLISGYRTDEEKKLVLDTDYQEIYDMIISHKSIKPCCDFNARSKDNGSPAQNETQERGPGNLTHLDENDFEMVIPLQEIIASSLFDIDAFCAFNRPS